MLKEFVVKLDQKFSNPKYVLLLLEIIVLLELVKEN